MYKGGGLSKMTYLDASNNNIDNLGTILKIFPNLDELTVPNNPILTPLLVDLKVGTKI